MWCSQFPDAVSGVGARLSAAGVASMSSLSRHGVRAFQFTKAGQIHKSPTDIASEAAAALAGAPDGATFVTSKSEDGTLQHTFVTADSPAQESVAFALAQAMAAASNEVDDVPDLVSARAVAELVVDGSVTPSQDTQAGADFTTLARIIGNLLQPGEWVAVSVRKPSRSGETKKQVRWLDHHGQRTHHSRLSGAVVVSMFAGASTSRRAVEVASRVAAGIPGFGLRVTARPVSVAPAVMAWMALAGAGFAAAVLGVTTGWLAPLLAAVGTAVAAVGAAGAFASFRGLLPSASRTVREHLRWGLVPTAPRRVLPPKPPRAERVRYDKEGVLHTEPEFTGDYPLSPSAFLVGPHIPVALVAPHSGSSAAVTAARHAPPEMRVANGPAIGVIDGEMTYLDYGDLWAGVSVLGQAGSGKTKLLEHWFGTMLRDRTRGVVGAAPVGHSMIAFDTKGDGLATQQYQAWAEHVGDQNLTVFHVLDQAGHDGIDLFPVLPGEDIDMWARKVVSALVYIWGEDSIGARSFDTLRRVLEAGLAISDSPHLVWQIESASLPVGASPFLYADVLLTNRGDQVGVELATAIKNAAADKHDANRAGFAYVWERLAPIYGDGKTQAQRAQLVDAPRTKIAALMSAEHWWSRPNRRTWSDLLSSHTAVVLNTGIGPSGTLPDDRLREDMSGLLLYTLREDIRRTCVGWFDQGKAVSIFADEVKHIANTNDRVIRALRDDDRALGVRCVFATQTPETLTPEVRRTFLGFGTLVMFRQEERNTVNELVGDLTLSGEGWTSADIVNLPRFHAIVRATAGGRRQEPFMVTVPSFQAQRDAGAWQ